MSVHEEFKKYWESIYGADDMSDAEIKDVLHFFQVRAMEKPVKRSKRPEWDGFPG
jgi:hypothetical protein